MWGTVSTQMGMSSNSGKHGNLCQINIAITVSMWFLLSSANIVNKRKQDAMVQGGKFTMVERTTSELCWCYNTGVEQGWASCGYKDVWYSFILFIYSCIHHASWLSLWNQDKKMTVLDYAATLLQSVTIKRGGTKTPEKYIGWDKLRYWTNQTAKYEQILISPFLTVDDVTALKLSLDDGCSFIAK